MKSNNRSSKDRNVLQHPVWIIFYVLVLVSAILSVPFLKSIQFSWKEMNSYLQGIVFCLTAALFCHAYFSFRIRNAAALLIISFLVSYLAEGAGSRWAWPFSSRYHYNPDITPKLPGGVPLCILLVWFMLAYTALIFCRPISIQNKNSFSIGKLFFKAALCGLYITAADLVIDPLAILTKAWTWHENGAYFGVPVGNFSGWFLVGFIIFGGYLIFEKSNSNPTFKDIIMVDAVFTAVSISFTLLCYTACLIHVDSPLPVVLALIVMGGFWTYWAASAWENYRKLKM